MRRMATIIGMSGSLRRDSLNSKLLRAAAGMPPPEVAIEIASLLPRLGRDALGGLRHRQLGRRRLISDREDLADRLTDRSRASAEGEPVVQSVDGSEAALDRPPGSGLTLFEAEVERIPDRARPDAARHDEAEHRHTATTHGLERERAEPESDVHGVLGLIRDAV